MKNTESKIMTLENANSVLLEFFQDEKKYLNCHEVEALLKQFQNVCEDELLSKEIVLKSTFEALVQSYDLLLNLSRILFEDKVRTHINQKAPKIFKEARIGRIGTTTLNSVKLASLTEFKKRLKTR